CRTTYVTNSRPFRRGTLFEVFYLWKISRQRAIFKPVAAATPACTRCGRGAPSVSTAPQTSRKSRRTFVDPTFAANERGKRFTMQFVIGTVTEHTRPLRPRSFVLRSRTDAEAARLLPKFRHT